MLKKDQGYGICGAKNVYSSKVKLGNWTEDEAGAMISQLSRPGFSTYATEQRENYCPFEKRRELPQANVKIPTTQELVTRNKEGSPYALLFSHGMKDIPSQERFQTMGKLSLSSADFSKAFILPERTLQKERYRKIQAEQKAAILKTTEARAANSFKGDINPLISPTKVQTELPIWTR